MFRSLMTIVREHYLYVTKVIFMLKHLVKLRRHMHLVMWHHVVERHADRRNFTECFNINITLVRYR